MDYEKEEELFYQGLYIQYMLDSEMEAEEIVGSNSQIKEEDQRNPNNGDYNVN